VRRIDHELGVADALCVPHGYQGPLSSTYSPEELLKKHLPHKPVQIHVCSRPPPSCPPLFPPPSAHLQHAFKVQGRQPDGVSTHVCAVFFGGWVGRWCVWEGALQGSLLDPACV